jgi:hypothetical protein
MALSRPRSWVSPRVIPPFSSRYPLLPLTPLSGYKYFEKVRIFEGKKKTAKHLRMEEKPFGIDKRDAKAWGLNPPHGF